MWDSSFLARTRLRRPPYTPIHWAMASGGIDEYFFSTAAVAVAAFGGRKQKRRAFAAWSLMLGMLDDEIDSWFEGPHEDGAP